MSEIVEQKLSKDLKDFMKSVRPAFANKRKSKLDIYLSDIKILLEKKYSKKQIKEYLAIKKQINTSTATITNFMIEHNLITKKTRKTPNKTTVEAMKELECGNGIELNTLSELNNVQV